MLKKKNRLGRSAALSYVIRRGRTTRTHGFLIRTVRTHLPLIRFAVSISQKAEKKAVNRNKVRRQLYGLLRLRIESMVTGIDCSISVQREAFGHTSKEREEIFLTGLKRARLLS